MPILEATITGWKKVYHVNGIPGIPCEYKNCKQKADYYWSTENEAGYVKSIDKYRCKKHLYK